MNGKGDKRRPGDAKKYREGWARIFGSKHKVKRDRPEPYYNKPHHCGNYHCAGDC
jgi:hypothetical protein